MPKGLTTSLCVESLACGSQGGAPGKRVWGNSMAYLSPPAWGSPNELCLQTLWRVVETKAGQRCLELH